MNELLFQSHRSPVYGTHGAVSTSQPLASQIGLDILKKGGNAIDASVAIAAALNLTEPCSTGYGGDMFLLYYEASTKQVHAVNGSGRMSKNINIDSIKTANNKFENMYDANTVTVPGSAAGWIDSLEKFGSGKLTLDTIFHDVIDYAENGFPVGPITAHQWLNIGFEQLKNNRFGEEKDMLVYDVESKSHRPPKAGELFVNKNMASVLRSMIVAGKKGFYEGPVAEAIVKKVQQYGGCLDLQDMKSHVTTFPDAIKTTFNKKDIWEVPPNGQGITALIALNIISNLDLTAEEVNDDGKRTHNLVEALRLGFADAAQFVTDIDTNECPVEGLLSMEYAKVRSELIHADKPCSEVHAGNPPKSSCTVSFQVCDSEGNSVSAVNSNYMVFGTGLVPEGCGFTLQNRGYNFTFEAGHPNCIAPNKRPYHTIIPGMATHSESSDLYCSFTNMGGFMQPQGHVQLLVNMLLRKLDPQTAVDQPRFCIGGSLEGKSMNKHYVINYEEGFSPDAILYLQSLGHPVKMISSYDRNLFGRAQIIQRSEVVDPITKKKTIIWCCGSDGRADGQALAY